MLELDLKWKQAFAPAALWVGSAAILVIPLAHLALVIVIHGRTASSSQTPAETGGRLPVTEPSLLLAGLLLALVLVAIPVAAGLVHGSWRVAVLTATLTLITGLAVARTLRSPAATGSPPLATPLPGPAAAAADIARDEEIVFFPTSAWHDPTRNAWLVPVHGVIYEPEADSRTRATLVAAIRKSLDVAPGSPEADLLTRRVRLFLVDNERRKQIAVRIGTQCYAAGSSAANGHFQVQIQLPATTARQLLGTPQVEGRQLEFEAVTASDDPRHFRGRVQLIGPHGLSVISDIDDTIKRSQVGNHREVLANTFLRPFTAAPSMPELYRRLANEGAVFHYVSGSPWQLYQPLVEFFAAVGLPPGSCDLKHFRLKDSSALGLLQDSREMKLPAITRLLESYPQRRFLLIGDSGEQDPEIYAQVTREHPRQIAAVLIRNVTREQSDNARFTALKSELATIPLILFQHPQELEPALGQILAATLESEQTPTEGKQTDAD